jgi:hypothetical protein
MSLASADPAPGGRTWIAAGLLALALLPACRRREPPRAPAIGEGFVAPETLSLRKEISLSSPSVATIRRGERVEIIQKRRRFVKVRTAANQEGWTEQGQLLTPELERQIDQLAKQSAGLPSFGIYHTRDKLNIHFEPYRWSPTFYQLKEEEKVDLLGRRRTERSSTPPYVNGAPATAADPAKPRQYDDWYFIRTRPTDGPPRAGWVLARMVEADIPDEVAQYAEGRRITSYFSLGEVRDEDQVKKIWLWTTLERGNEQYDFDSFRVFNWGKRRHRYETAYIERRLGGRFPVSIAPYVETKWGKGPGFSIIVEKDDGQRYIRRYVMLQSIVRRYAEEPFVAPPPAPAAQPASPVQEARQPSLLERVWRRMRGRRSN